jgi:hypothetical protein
VVKLKWRRKYDLFGGCTKRLHKFEVLEGYAFFDFHKKSRRRGVNLQGILRLVRPVYKYVQGGGLINRGAARAVRKLH